MDVNKTMKQLFNTGKKNLDPPSLRRPSQCPVEDWLGFLGHRWNALLLWHLSSGAKRHGELMACLPGMTPKVMTERLEGLETRGLVCRSLLTTYPRGVRYALTERGEQLVAILDQIEIWSKLEGN